MIIIENTFANVRLWIYYLFKFYFRSLGYIHNFEVFISFGRTIQNISRLSNKLSNKLSKVYKHLCYRNNYDIKFLILVTIVLIKLLSKLNVIFTVFVLL